MAVLLGLLIVSLSGVFDKRIDAFFDSPDDLLAKYGPPAFLATKLPRLEAPHNATLGHRLWLVYVRIHERFRTRNPAAYRFGPSPIGPCSLDGLLNQCMQVTGTRYLIAREALGGVVYFGHTNTLNGAQWVAAFEQTLRTNGMILLSNKAGVVKVIPKTKLDAYRKAGLVKRTDQQM